MRSFFARTCARTFIGVFFLTVFSFPYQAHAEYRLQDSIEEFGEARLLRGAVHRFAEKRYFKPTPARLKAGPVIFHPTLETQVTWDDNILLESQDAKQDIVFDILPGAIIEIPIDTHQIVVGYEADFEVFTKRSDQNDQNQNAFALIDLSFPNWYINILDRFSETSSRSATTFTGRIPRYDHSINPKIGYRWKRMTFEGSFSHTLRDYRRQVNDSLDFELTDWTGVVYVDLFARLKALVEYKVAQIDYDDNFLRKGQFQQTRVGLEGFIRPNLRIDTRVGAQWRNYEEEERNDFNSWIGSIELEYALLPNLIFDTSFHREAVESTDARSNFYTEHSVSIGAEYGIRPRWTLYADGAYFRHDYSERTTVAANTAYRHDHHGKAEVGLRYEFREWWQMELAYTFLRRNSNFSVFDYTNNRLSLTSSVTY